MLAVPDNPKLPESDSGVSKTYAFRTPSLRNLSVTAPYMHNGVFASLNDVVNFYQRISGGAWASRRRREAAEHAACGAPSSTRK